MYNLHKRLVGFRHSGPIDRTPGIPGSDNKIWKFNKFHPVKALVVKDARAGRPASRRQDSQEQEKGIDIISYQYILI